MSIGWVNKTYGLSAKRGGRVEYTGGAAPEVGTIKSASDGYLNIKLDSRKHVARFHPTWKLRFINAAALTKEPTP